MNFDLYEFLKYHNGSKFYPVKVEVVLCQDLVQVKIRFSSS